MEEEMGMKFDTDNIHVEIASKDPVAILLSAPLRADYRGGSPEAVVELAKALKEVRREYPDKQFSVVPYELSPNSGYGSPFSHVSSLLVVEF